MILVVAVALAIVIHGLQRPAGYLQLPTLIGLLCLGWFVPQLAQIAGDTTVPASGLNRLLAMITLSLGAFWAGWYATPSTVRTRPPPDFSRLVPAAAILTFVSVGINLLLESYRADMSGIQQWSGPITIIAFFAQIRDIALAVSLLLFLGHRTRVTGILLLLNLAITVPVAFTLLRRSEMIGLGAATICAFWFARRQQISMVIMIPAALALSVVIYVIGPLRGAARTIEIMTGQRPNLFDPVLWSSIDLNAAIASSAQKALDVRNALYLIDYHAESYAYGFGSTVWNGLMKLYVPGQIFGYEFKQSLYIGERGGAYDDILLLYDFRFAEGTTATGFGSAFADFGYLGALNFLIMAVVLKRMFARAEAGSFWSQVAYMCFLPLVMVSMTHGHDRFYISIPFLVTIILLFRAISERRFVFRSSQRGIR